MRIGVVGTGKIGQLRATTVREHSSTQLVAVHDVNAESARRAAAGSGAVVAPSLEAFFDVPMDAVVVSTPVHVHDDTCLTAFARGLHLLVEKPVTNTAATTRRLVDAAIAARRAFGVGFNLRYYPAVKFMREAIAEGRIGTVDHFRVYGGHEGLPKFVHDWEFKAPMSGGGAMWDVGIHMTDLTRYFLGEITDVYGISTNRIWHVPGSEDNAMAVFKSPEGVAASYHATWTEWKGYGFFIEAYGDKGMVRAAYAPMRNTLITMDRPGGARSKQERYYPEIILREKLFSWKTTALQSFREELDDFLALADGRRDLTIADGYAGLRAAEVAEAVRDSAASGAPVRLPVLGRMPA
ncbi:MAG: Gfo/Idh/MocA family protein [Vicinamibacterales bacterium]